MLPSISKRLRIGVAMSGGVDSCVAAYLLANAGHEVLGIHMRNWDERDENGVCHSEQDWKDVQSAVARLPGSHPPPIQLNFVKEYWQNVFSPFVEDYASGITPNPDVACNREIKFKSFRDRAFSLGVDAIATGHYARLTTSCVATPPLLVTARDTFKDQTYFLSQVSSKNLKNVLFPLGEFNNKHQVKKIARDAGFDVIAEKKESMGICFIGKRRFGDFISEYVDVTPGKFISIEDGSEVGKHRGAETYTIGQGARISGARDNLKWFVCGKSLTNKGDVLVAPSSNHGSLYCDELYLKLSDFLWAERDDPLFDVRKARFVEMDVGGNKAHLLRSLFRLRHGQPLNWCTVEMMNAQIGGRSSNQLLKVKFDRPIRAVSPGQVISFYTPLETHRRMSAKHHSQHSNKDDDDVGFICLGGGPIDHPGPSYHEMGKSTSHLHLK